MPPPPGLPLRAEPVTPAALAPTLVVQQPAPAGTLHLQLANDIAAVAAALPALQGFAVRHGLAPRLANRLEVVFEELASNVIRHGFTPGAGQSLHVVLGVNDRRLQLVFEDDGPAFDPLARPAPAPLSDLGSAPEGGLGIALVQRVASRFVREDPPRRPGMINRIVVELPRA